MNSGMTLIAEQTFDPPLSVEAGAAITLHTVIEL
jgi:hypothetical protein